MSDQLDQLYFEEHLDDEEDKLDIAKYIAVLYKRKWLIIAITLLVSIPWAIYIKRQPPIYQAETIIRFKDYAGLDPTLLETRMTELNSRRFSEKVVKQLGLVLKIQKLEDSKRKINRSQIFQEFSTAKQPVPGNYRLVFNKDKTYKIYYGAREVQNEVVVIEGSIAEATYESQTVNGFSFRFVDSMENLPHEIPFQIVRFRSAVNSLLSNKQVKLRDGGGPLLTLTMSADDPIMVTKTVNRLAEIYKNESMDVKNSEAREKLKILKERIDIAKVDLSASEMALSAFQASYTGDFDRDIGKQLVENTKFEDELELYGQQHDDLRNMLKKLDKESKGNGEGYNRNLRYVHESLTKMATFDNNPEMLILRQRLNDVEQQRDAIIAEFSEDNYQAKELEGKIKTIHTEIKAVAKAHLSQLSKKIRNIRNKLSSIQARMRNQPRQRQQLLKLQSDYETKKELWSNLDSQYQNALMNLKVNTENIEVFQEAIVPEFPMNSDKAKKAIMGGVFGFVLGIAVALGLEFLDKTLKTVDDIKKYLKLQVLGTIPQINFKGTDEYKDSEKIKQIDNQLVTHDYSPTPIGEAYRSLRTNLMFSKKSDRIHSFVVTSTAPGDGKSFTSSNIAISMAQQRSNTLLIDADLRRGVLHNTFGIPKEPGFTNFLTNIESFSRIINETYIPNLSVISCGSLLPNPSELLGSLQMKRFLEQALRRFEVVIFDSPPLNAATDAVVIGTQVDGIVIVIRAGMTNRDVVKQKIEMFHNVPATILGAVLNGAETNLAHEGYSYYHY